MGKLKIRTDDEVVVIAGKDKGKRGKVLRVDIRNQKVFVEGLNIIKRHQRPSPMRPNAPAGVIEKEGPIHISNVAIWDPTENRPTRVGLRRTEDGKPMRVTKRSGTELD